ncbi:sigma-70 family RNA polymerase sigma factor [Cytophagaceae bacterium DM2B3-1]|uniref:Sigma-70 family RNA polymerase sigma factor n=1 Tax=Xanthocytophaga flava TaxID=3048013 RepID=A0ABT7CS65_9BACT|nr:sigma-70 family RNA polymerase sigma factor [Xanthocytophaga flavus]MDJ1468576.1 sigma-70 family RNA polymerase sigma factor [Xanthocytophaga flavus]MDJ1496356.1 sigma-70 family RNA polymerase sigma factor [Xanthocytophaga flavus]
MKQYENPDDATLVRQILQGEDWALTHVYHTHWPMILRLVQLNSGTEEDAKDIYQEIIIHLYEKIKEGNFILTCQLKTYLYAVGRKKWLNRLRGNHFVRDSEEVLEDLPEIIEEESFMPEPAQLQNGIEQLGEPCRTLLIYFYYEKMSLEQIASHMQYASPNVAKQQKFRCIERLKKNFLSLHTNGF